MPDENKTERQKKIKSFEYKYQEFLILYGILNIYFFFYINNIVNTIRKSFSKLYTSDFMIDGSNFSPIINLFATPIFIFQAVVTIGFVLILIFILILILNLIYFKSAVEYEEKNRLNHYIKKTLLCFLLINFIIVIFLGSIQRSFLFMFMYMFLPLFTYFLTCSKINKQ